MHQLSLSISDRPLRILCLGSHADDIEIGCGATLLELLASGSQVSVDWCVLSAEGERRPEAEASAAAFLRGAREANVDIQNFRDAYFPTQSAELKTWFEGLKSRPRPDVIFTHTRHDLHQDHRTVCDLTWNTFRDHLILEYETPKWDGDLGVPNSFMAVSEANLMRKIELLMMHYGSQRRRAWFDVDLFRAIARIRGMECGSPTRFAEAFFARKIALNLAQNPSR